MKPPFLAAIDASERCFLEGFIFQHFPSAQPVSLVPTGMTVVKGPKKIERHRRLAHSGDQQPRA